MKKISKELFDTIRDMMCEGVSSKDIAKNTLIGISTVNFIGACYNWDDFQKKKDAFEAQEQAKLPSKEKRAEYHRKKMEKIMSDPELYEAYKAKERARYHRRMEDPVYAESERLRNRIRGKLRYRKQLKEEE